jgi:hypothetical protein
MVALLSATQLPAALAVSSCKQQASDSNWTPMSRQRCCICPRFVQCLLAFVLPSSSFCCCCCLAGGSCLQLTTQGRQHALCAMLACCRQKPNRTAALHGYRACMQAVQQ